MTAAPTPAPMTEGQRAFAKARLHYLDRLLNLFKIGTVGVKKVREELQAEATNFRQQIALDDVAIANAPKALPGLPAPRFVLRNPALDALRPFAEFGKVLVAMAVPGNNRPMEGEVYSLMFVKDGEERRVDLTMEQFKAAIAATELVGGEP